MLRPHRPLRWPHALQRLAVVLPLAVLAALALVGINEAGYQRSHQALQQLAHSQATHSSVNRLLPHLDAEIDDVPVPSPRPAADEPALVPAR